MLLWQKNNQSKCKILIFWVIAVLLCAKTLQAQQVEKINAQSDTQDNEPKSQTDKQKSSKLTKYEHNTNFLETFKDPDSVKLTTNKILPLYMHNAFYIMPYYYSLSVPQTSTAASMPQATSSQQTAPNKRYETKFQISFKTPIQNIDQNNTFYFGYTQTYFFQNYNAADSRPFRDIDYKPELFWQHIYEQGALKYFQLGYAHTSNGERNERSRTRNRLFLLTHFQWIFFENLKFGVKPRIWTYFGDRADSFLEDNPDLVKYQGYGEILVYAQTKRNIIELELSPFVADYSHYKPFFRAAYSFRLGKSIALYAQYFNGYGDNMFEYNHSSSHIGVGFRIWQDY